jgi:hypothetical protein
LTKSTARTTGAKLVIIPTPTGVYCEAKESWLRDSSSLFEPDEICHFLDFLRKGGRLLAFAYRFGDSFTKTNLSQLFATSEPIARFRSYHCRLPWRDYTVLAVSRCLADPMPFSLSGCSSNPDMTTRLLLK